MHLHVPYHVQGPGRRPNFYVLEGLAKRSDQLECSFVSDKDCLIDMRDVPGKTLFRLTCGLCIAGLRSLIASP